MCWEFPGNKERALECSVLRTKLSTPSGSAGNDRKEISRD